MSEPRTETIDWAWAVVDRVITPTATGFFEHHTVAVAPIPDPRPRECVHGPERAPNMPGGGYPNFFSPLKDWGWELVSDLEYYPTKVMKAVDTKGSFGRVEPYRGIARIRRARFGTSEEEHAPVSYGANLAVLLSDDDRDSRGASTSELVAALHETLPTHVREHGWPRIGVDSYPVCRIVAELVATHPDAAFRAEGLALARTLAATGGVDPDHLALLAATVTPEA